jgi:hypothetical protein
MNSYPVAIMFSVVVVAVSFIFYLLWFKGTSALYQRVTKLEAEMSQLAMSQGLKNRTVTQQRPPIMGG